MKIIAIIWELLLFRHPCDHSLVELMLTRESAHHSQTVRPWPQCWPGAQS
jgi:hypothetical protein